MADFEYTVKSTDRGLTYIFLEEAKKYKDFDATKSIDWNSVMAVFDEIQTEKQQSNSSLFSGGTDKTRSGWGSSYAIHENDKIELTEAQVNKIYQAMGVDVSKGKKTDTPADNSGGNPAQDPAKKPAQTPGVPTGMHATDRDGVFYDEETKKHYQRDDAGNVVEIKPVNNNAKITQYNQDGSHYEREYIEGGGYILYLVDTNGKNKEKTSYGSDGKRQWELRYDDKGNIVRELYYKDGKLNKIVNNEYNDKNQKVKSRRYDGSGKFKSEERYEYHTNGKTKTKKVFGSNGKLSYINKYHTNGKQSTYQKYKDGKWQVDIYYDTNGNETGGKDQNYTWTVTKRGQDFYVRKAIDKNTNKLSHYERFDNSGKYLGMCDANGNLLEQKK